MLARASTSALGVSNALHCFAPVASSSRRLLSTTAPVSSSKKTQKTSKEKKHTKKKVQVKASMPFDDAIRMFSALEVGRPLNAYEIRINAAILPHQANALRGRLAMPNEVRLKPEHILIFADDGSDAERYVKSLMEEDPAMREQITLGGIEFIDDVAAERGAAADLEYTRVLSTKKCIGPLTKALARNLGPRNLMPSAKRGTVVETADEMRKAIREAQTSFDWSGDKEGQIIASIARAHFTEKQVRENISTFLHGIFTRIAVTAQSAPGLGLSEINPAGLMTSTELERVRGVFKRVHLSTTQGPGVLLDVKDIM